MDRVIEFQELLKQILREHAGLKPSYGDIEVETIFDDAQGHYEVAYTGWDGLRRVHGAIIHVDIRDDKIWIQHDGTEGGVANELVEAGVPKDRIVLGFHHPHKRPYTGFAAA
jgi:hypothetical protein